MIQTVTELCTLSGISGREHGVRDYILQKLAESPVSKTITVDPLGNVIVTLKGEKTAPKKVAFAAHMDEVGLMITGVTAEGFLRFEPLGISHTVLFGKRVLVGDRVGVIGGKAVHQCSAEEKKTCPKADALYIDIGVDSREEALAVAKPGQSAVFVGDPVALGHKLKAKALDDRAGCALLLELAKEPPLYDITLLFTVQEEVGCRGAKTAGYAVQPDYAVVVDVTTAADVAGVPADQEVSRQGRGGAVSFMDCATVYDKPLFDWVCRRATEEQIPLQCKEKVAGGNDAGTLQSAGVGTRVTALSLPGRYIHSPSSVVDPADMTALLRLLRLVARELPEGTV